MSKWQIVAESEPDTFTPATAQVPPDAIWDDGQGEMLTWDAKLKDWAPVEGYDRAPLQAKLDELKAAHGLSFGANYQLPAKA